LPIPFMHRTDIETGKEVLLNKGSLAELWWPAPHFFLIFSGRNRGRLSRWRVTNNYPIDEVKLGADIIIGVDVQI
jgi:NTE family protein